MSGATPVCGYILIANIAVFVAQLLTLNNPNGVTALFELAPSQVYRNWELWRLITSGFCHDPFSVMHIGLNMLAFWSFARTLEIEDGSREFGFFYFCALLASSLAWVLLGWYLRRDNPAIGASGAVAGVLTLYALRYPRAPISIIVVTVEARWLVLAYLVFDIVPVLRELGGQPNRDGIAHVGHLGGMAYAFLYWQFDLRLKHFPQMDLRRAIRRRPKLRIYEEPPAPSRPVRPAAKGEDSAALQQQVDDILAKINRSGMDSLTSEERRTLEDASRRYRDKHS